MEITTDGKALSFCNKPKVKPLKQLTPAQLEWCRKNLKGFGWPGVQRLSDGKKEIGR